MYRETLHNRAAFGKAVVLSMCFSILLVVAARAEAQDTTGYAGLDTWEQMEYVPEHNIPPAWIFPDDGTRVTQMANSGATALVSQNSTDAPVVITGYVRVERLTWDEAIKYSNGDKQHVKLDDDDSIGLVFQSPNGDLVIISWKRETQNETKGDMGWARQGVSIKHLSADGQNPWRREEIWRTNDEFSDRVQNLVEPPEDDTGVGWEFDKNYHFTGVYMPGEQVRFIIREGVPTGATIYDESAQSSSLPSSVRPGIFNKSQAKTAYRNSRVAPVIGFTGSYRSSDRSPKFGGRSVGFVVPQQNGADGPQNMIWDNRDYGYSMVTVSVNNLIGGGSYTLKLRGQRNRRSGCGSGKMNNAVNCGAIPDNLSTLRLWFDSGDNSDLPSGRYTGMLIINALSWWDGTYSEVMVFEIDLNTAN